MPRNLNLEALRERVLSSAVGSYDPKRPPRAQAKCRPSTARQQLVSLSQRTATLGALRILVLIVLRPIMAHLCSRIFLLMLRPFKSRFLRLFVYLPAYASFCAPEMTYRLLRLLMSKVLGIKLHLERENRVVKDGIFFKEGGIGERVALISGLRKKVSTYWSPFMNGDWSTIAPTALHMIKGIFLGPKSEKQPGPKGGSTIQPPVTHHRLLFKSSVGRDAEDGEVFLTDWTFPSVHREGAGVCVLLAGVGGSSNSGYITDVSRAFHEEGWVTCCINARGMQESPRVKRLENIFNPFQNSDLQTILDCISGRNVGVKEAKRTALTSRIEENRENQDVQDSDADVVLVGFSLGAISLGKYMTSKGASLSHCVRASIMFSGAFSMDFANWWRYRFFFQKMIVPRLVADFISKYSKDLMRKFSKERLLKICAASSYKDLVTDLLLPAMRRHDGSDGALGSYKEFQESGKSERADLARISRPTLLVTALDDPLHNPEMLGFSTVDSIESSSLVYMITQEGGHVGWPTELGGSSAFMRETAVSFAKAACEVAHT